MTVRRSRVWRQAQGPRHMWPLGKGVGSSAPTRGGRWMEALEQYMPCLPASSMIAMPPMEKATLQRDKMEGREPLGSCCLRPGERGQCLELGPWKWSQEERTPLREDTGQNFESGIRKFSKKER